MWVNVIFAIEAIALMCMPSHNVGLLEREVQWFMISSLVWTSLFVHKVEVFRLVLFVLSLAAIFFASGEWVHQAHYILCAFFTFFYPLFPELMGLNDPPVDSGERQVILTLPCRTERVVAVELNGTKAIADIQPWCMTQWFNTKGVGMIPYTHFSKRALRYIKVNHLWTVKTITMGHNTCYITLE